MAGIKVFNFVSFDEWLNSGEKWQGKIGDYNCEVSAFSWGDKSVTYTLAISIYEEPLNIYACTLYRNSYRYNHEDKKDLRNWYNQVTQDANKAWCEYIKKTYLWED